MTTPLRLQCQYPYKTCTNIRAMKKDGDVHKLCALHRDRANSIQKIYATKRRHRMRELRKARGTPTRRIRAKATIQPVPFAAPGTPVNPFDLETLHELLMENEAEPIWTESDSDDLSVEECDILNQILH
ncbi:Aste57867_335 [Aphanomyces stellatus]|uniref:Aste57867_335 protein n=1 Tax=Aphanomyces stellatus TaxID=120398 RepID=A0A485K7B3_9STRA|nr:hypothetical protein As57867_000335 [Aphanomyces stellatus]VFT77561.1 Aste57867_335 [Aphanomyces stellatus]